MAKKWRKPRPEPPYHYWLDTDYCWFCSNRHGCSGCKFLKRYIAEHEKPKRNLRKKIDFDFEKNL